MTAPAVCSAAAYRERRQFLRQGVFPGVTGKTRLPLGRPAKDGRLWCRDMFSGAPQRVASAQAFRARRHPLNGGGTRAPLRSPERPCRTSSGTGMSFFRQSRCFSPSPVGTEQNGESCFAGGDGKRASARMPPAPVFIREHAMEKGSAGKIKKGVVGLFFKDSYEVHVACRLMRTKTENAGARLRKSSSDSRRPSSTMSRRRAYPFDTRREKGAMLFGQNFEAGHGSSREIRDVACRME